MAFAVGGAGQTSVKSSPNVVPMIFTKEFQAQKAVTGSGQISG